MIYVRYVLIFFLFSTWCEFSYANSQCQMAELEAQETFGKLIIVDNKHPTAKFKQEISLLGVKETEHFESGTSLIASISLSHIRMPLSVSFSENSYQLLLRCSQRESGQCETNSYQRTGRYEMDGGATIIIRFTNKEDALAAKDKIEGLIKACEWSDVERYPLHLNCFPMSLHNKLNFAVYRTHSYLMK